MLSSSSNSSHTTTYVIIEHYKEVVWPQHPRLAHFIYQIPVFLGRRLEGCNMQQGGRCTLKIMYARSGTNSTIIILLKLMYGTRQPKSSFQSTWQLLVLCFQFLSVLWYMPPGLCVPTVVRT